MEFQDKVLKCIDCGRDFLFTAGEQLFFHDKQFRNEPKRCQRNAKLRGRQRAGTGPISGPELPLSQGRNQGGVFTIGKETTVPFRPTQGVQSFAGNASSRSGRLSPPDAR